MSKTIAQLWNGNLDPVRYSGRTNQEMKQLEVLLQRNLDTLEEALNDPQKKLFEKYNTQMDEYLIVANEQAFCDGFCLGARMMAEAFSGSEQQL